MTRRFSRRTVLAGSAAVAAGAHFRPARAQAATTLVLSHHLTTQHVLHETAERFAARVRELTNGRLLIDIRPNAQLFNNRTSAEALQLGTLDLAWSDLGSLANWQPYIGFTAVPFLFKDFDHVRRVFYGPVGERVVRDVRNDLRIDILALTASGFRVFYTRRPWRTVADMAGARLRVPEITVYIEMARALGANPTPIPVNEVYTALQTGVVDGSEGAPDYIEATRLYEVSRYLTRTNHILTEVSLMGSVDRLGRLPAEHQAALRQAAEEVVRQWYWQRNLEIQETAFERLAQRMEWVRDADIASFRARMAPVMDSFVSRSGPKARQYIQDVVAAGTV